MLYLLEMVSIESNLAMFIIYTHITMELATVDITTLNIPISLGQGNSLEATLIFNPH